MKLRKRLAQLWAIITALGILSGAAVGVSAVEYEPYAPPEGVQADSAPLSAAPGFNADVVTVGVRGSYYANNQEALDRINAIRLEACREGVRNPANPSKKLTINDYRPLKWSTSLERIARQRAAEACLKRGHARPDGRSYQTADIYDVTSSYEILAWSNTQNLVNNINQYYEEKNAWVYQTGEISGHYEAMINPQNTHVGCGGFYSPECCSYGAAMCAHFTFDSNVSNNSFCQPTSTVMVPIRVLSSCLSAPRIVERSDNTDQLHLGSSTVYEMWSTTQIDDMSGKVFFIDNLTWSSSNPNVARVEGGRVTTLSMGKTTITAVSSTGVSASVYLQVTAPEVSITLDKSKLHLESGQSFQLEPTLLPENTPYNSIVWKSSDSTVASVSDGRVTAKSIGTVLITAKAMSGEVAKCTVIVTNPPTSVTLNKTHKLLGVGETAQLKATVPPNCTPDIQWTTSNSDVVTVDKGTLTAKSVGTASVTATTTNGKTAVCTVEVRSAPSVLNMSYTEKAIGLGEAYTLIASVPEDCASDSITWSSNNSKVVSVDKGKLKALQLGSATITATTYNGCTATCSVRVREAPTALSLDPTIKTIGVGERTTLSAVINKGEASGKITWTTNNESVLTVSGGVIKGVSEGTAVVTAATFNGKTAQCTVTVKAAPLSIMLDNSSVTLGVDEQLELKATIPEGSASDKITWISSDNSVVSVKNGSITALKNGSAVVSAKTFNGKIARCSVKVKDAPEAITLSESKIILGAGETVNMDYSLPQGSASALTWTTSNSEIAAVDEGRIAALQEGTATVSVRTYNGKKASCVVVVRSAPEELTLSETELTIGLGEIREISPLINKGSASAITWTSSNSRVVSVNNGLVFSLRTGTATITARTYNGLQASCTVKVVSAPDEITLSKEFLVLGLGEKHQLEASIPEASASAILWTSSDESIVSVSDGKLTTLSQGRAVITAQTFNGKAAECLVNVKAAPAELTLSEAKLIVGAGEEFEIEAFTDQGSASTITWSTKSNIISLQDGRITANQTGTAVVTARTFNGLSAVCSVVVREAPEYVYISEQAVTLGEGESVELNAVLNKNSASRTLEWTSDSPDVVAVENGRLTALSQGRAIISVSTYNGLTAYCSVSVMAAPDYVYLEVPRQTIGMNENLSFKAVISPESASRLVWSSSNEEVITVKDGVIKTVGEGSAVITITAFNGVSDSCSITVKAAPEWVTLDQTKIYLGVGEVFCLKARIPDESAAALTWKSSNTDIAELDDGYVYAKGEGVSIVTVKTYNGKEARCTVVVKAAPQSIELSEEQKAIGIGESYILTASVPKNTASAAVEWFSSDESIVTVEDGTITGLRIGTAVIGVRTYNGMVDRCVINVKAAPQTLELSERKIIIGEGEAFLLNTLFVDGSASGTIKWTSSTQATAVVKDGLVQGLSAGATRITAKAYNGVKAICSVIVRSAPEEVSLDTSKIYLGLGESYKLTATLPKGSASALTWKTGNADIVGVDNGTITGNQEGATVVTVKTYNGKEAKCTVVVKAAPYEISLNETKKTLGVGETITLTAELPKGTASAALKWTTGNTAVAKVLSDGTVKAVGTGSTVIAVRTYNGVRAALKVTVRSAPQSLSLNKEKKYLGVGEKYLLQAVLPEGSASDTISWRSSDNDIVVVENGLVTARSNGTAIIEAKTFNGMTATCKVVVKNAPDDVALDTEEIILVEGETATLKATIPSGSSSALTWSVGNPDIASVSNGRLTALSTGRTKVTVRTYNGLSRACLVIVRAAPTDITVD